MKLNLRIIHCDSLYLMTSHSNPIFMGHTGHSAKLSCLHCEVLNDVLKQRNGHRGKEWPNSSPSQNLVKLMKNNYD